MKNIFKLLTLPVILIPLSSCSSPRNIVVSQNYEILNKAKPMNNESIADWTTSVDGNGIKYLMDANYNFVLYISSEQCSSCMDSKPQILNYIYETKTQMYLLDTLKYDEIYNEYSIFYNYTIGDLDANLVTPTILFYSGRTLMNKTIGSSRLLNQNSTNNLFRSATTLKNITVVKNYNDFSKIKNTNDTIFYLYNRDNSLAKSAYTSIIKDQINTLNKTIYIVEVDSFSDEEISAYKNEFNLTSTNPFMYYYNDSTIKDRVVCNREEDVSLFATFLNKFSTN